ncbi:hypothetical protein HK102_005711 [Quaeritorhiza haematococci]|nr:hypothetical protein HK102_005711 [Quaeritorhiza haematococci]
MRSSKRLSNILALVTGCCTGVQGQFSFSWVKYADVKDDVKFPEYSSEQRVLVAKQAQAVLDVYVNRQSKIANYGQNIDPLPRMSEILSNAATMSTTDFHTTLAKTFLNLRDLHTNYIFPAPHSCYRAVYPIQFTLIDSNDLVNDPQVAVKGFAKDEEVMGMAAEVAPVYEYEDWMTYLLPEETEVVYELKRGEKVYTVKAPIAVRIDDFCIAAASKQADGARLPATFKPQIPIQEQLRTFTSPLHNNIKHFFQSNQDYPINPTENDIISWGTYQHTDMNLGIIKIESFLPKRNSSAGETLLLVRKLLVDELRDTDALVFDVRDDGGGLVDLADGMLTWSRTFFLPFSLPVITEPQTETTATLGSFIEFKGSASWLTRLELIHNNQVVEQVDLAKSQKPVEFILKAASTVQSMGLEKYTIRGYFDGVQVMQVRSWKVWKDAGKDAV